MQLPPVPDDLLEHLRTFADAAHEVALRSKHPSHADAPPRRISDDELVTLVGWVADPLPWPVGGERRLRTADLDDHLPDPELVSLLREGPLRILEHPVHRTRVLAALVSPYALLHWLTAVEPDVRIADRIEALQWAGNASMWTASLGSCSGEERQRFFRERPDLAIEAIRSASVWGGWGYWGKVALHALETWDPRPSLVDDALFDVAVGNAREARARVRPLFSRDRTTARLVATLDDRSADRRAAAADWLPSLLGDDAIAPLTRRFRKEKSEPVRVAILTALQQLRVPVDTLLDRDALLVESSRRAAKLTPPAWLGQLALPALRWSDGVPVDPALARAWLITAHKDKKPEPSPMLRFIAAQLDRVEAATFATLVLRAFIEHDTRRQPLTEDADAALRARASQHVVWFGGDAEAVYTALRDHAELAQSTAIADKGVLAVVAAMGGAEIADEVRDYLRRWYGWRAAQCKALLQMLGWVEDLRATTLLLATSARFRTPGIRKEADLQVRALADRKGWTVDELADRTLPVAGLDDTGRLELSYRSGPEEDAPPTRRFVAWIDERLELALHEAAGTRLTALPAPRKGEDPGSAKGAKNALSRAKRELKELIQQLRSRLYVAMCTSRRWTARDWRTFLVDHPVASHAVRTLVWRDEAGRTFRPTPEGDLISASSELVALADDASVTVAHALQTNEDEGREWARHFLDFAIVPLFPQLGRPTYRAELAEGTMGLTTHVGHVVSAFALRAAAKRLGYERGRGEGGWFSTYERVLPSLGWTIVIEHTGSRLPEENVPIALREAWVESNEVRIPLDRAGAILTSELFADLETLSVEGEGLVADWQERVGWA